MNINYLPVEKGVWQVVSFSIKHASSAHDKVFLKVTDQTAVLKTALTMNICAPFFFIR